MIVPSWQQTFLALHEAQTTEELWIVLLVHHGIRSTSAWEEPYLLFRRFHTDDPTDAVTTALLMCTEEMLSPVAYEAVLAQRAGKHKDQAA